VAAILKEYESVLECPSENVLDEMSPDFGPQNKCPPDFILGKMSLKVNVLGKNIL
jgi:hypothetical protein